MWNEQLTTGNLLIDKICMVIAIHEPFTIDDIIEKYIESHSVDELLKAIETAKEQKCALGEASLSPPTDATNVVREEVTDMDKNEKRKWLKKKQRGIGVRGIRFRFGKEKWIGKE